MDGRVQAVRRLADETGFSGVVRIDVAGKTALAGAFGLADRAYAVPNRVETRFGLASATKGLTALTVVSLVDDGTLDLDMTARSLLGDDLPLVADDVTVEQLLAHRSGIGDYLDEESDLDVLDYVMPVPVHRLVTTEDYLAVLGGWPQKFAPGSSFSYCNGGYVLLALLAERSAGVAFAELVGQRVCRPAGMVATGFPRSDELPGDAARGYLGPQGLRSNVLHLPVVGSGDGGAYATVADVHTLWRAFLADRVVPAPWAAEMTRPRSDAPGHSKRYGLGFWLDDESDAVILEGYDAGVSFLSFHSPAADVTATVVSNTTDGAWPIAGLLRETLFN